MRATVGLRSGAEIEALRTGWALRHYPERSVRLAARTLCRMALRRLRRAS